MSVLWFFSELHLMFSLMDKVPNGIDPMLKDLEEHIISAGLADMVAAAETITTVSSLDVRSHVYPASRLKLWLKQQNSHLEYFSVLLLRKEIFPILN